MKQRRSCPFPQVARSSRVNRKSLVKRCIVFLKKLPSTELVIATMSNMRSVHSSAGLHAIADLRVNLPGACCDAKPFHLKHSSLVCFPHGHGSFGDQVPYDDPTIGIPRDESQVLGEDVQCVNRSGVAPKDVNGSGRSKLAMARSLSHFLFNYSM